MPDVKDGLLVVRNVNDDAASIHPTCLLPPPSLLVDTSCPCVQGIWKYLPGEQQRRVILNKKVLAIGLTDEDTMLDYIPLHEVTDIQRGDQKLTTLFDEIDADGSGEINRAELEKGLSEIGLTARQANAFFDDMDKDGNGDLTKDEFFALSEPLKNHLKSIIKMSTVPDGYNSGRDFLFFWVSTEAGSLSEGARSSKKEGESSVHGWFNRAQSQNSQAEVSEVDNWILATQVQLIFTSPAYSPLLPPVQILLGGILRKIVQYCSILDQHESVCRS